MNTTIALVSRAAARLPDDIVARERALIRAIARDARQRLGRPARRGRYLDTQAVDAILAAAAAAGVETWVAQWALPGASLTALARALVRRAAESYGRP